MLESEPPAVRIRARGEEDLERFCQGRPVQARPHSAWYAARRFAARHWLAVSATGLSVVALASLTIVSVYQSAQARAQAVRAQRVSEFAKNTFLSATSSWAQPSAWQARRDSVQRHSGQRLRAAGQELATIPRRKPICARRWALPMPCSVNRRKGKRNCFWGSNCSRGFVAALPGLRPIFMRICAMPAPFRAATPTRWPHAARRWRSIAWWTTAVLGAVLHDSAFMAVNAGEPLPDAESMYREARQFPPRPALVSGSHHRQPAGNASSSPGRSGGWRAPAAGRGTGAAREGRTAH
jgi:hypothetical protein